MKLTEQQQQVLDNIKVFLDSDVPVFILKGYEVKEIIFQLFSKDIHIYIKKNIIKSSIIIRETNCNI